MYNNIVSQGVAAQKMLYGPSGDRVIDAYHAASIQGKMKQQILTVMEQEIKDIKEIKPTAFKHISDQSKVNVIDISPRSIVEGKETAFEQAIVAELQISRHFFPPSDPAYHIEIPQPAGK